MPGVLPSPRRRPNGRMGASAWALVSEATMAVGAFVSLTQLGLVLSLAEFGVLASVQALVRPALALATVGAPAVLIRRVAQQMDRDAIWRRALLVWGVGSLAAAAILIAGKPVLLGPADWLPYILLVLAHTIWAAHPEMLFGFATGLGDMRLAAVSRFIATIPRVVALGVFALSTQQDLMTWSVLALLSHLVGTAASVAYSWSRLRLALLPARLSVLPAEARSGSGFALGGVSSGTLDASDRPILVNSNLGVDAGNYAFGTRLLAFAMLPALAIMRASGAEVFGAAAGGLRAVSRATVKWMWPIVGLNLVIGVALFFGAGLLHRVLPGTHDDVVEVVRWLAWLPLVRSIQQLAGNALDATGFPFIRFWLTMAAAVLNLALNLWLIPRYGWRAAAGTTALAEALLTVSLVGIVGYGSLHRWEQRVLPSDVGLNR